MEKGWNTWAKFEGNKQSDKCRSNCKYSNMVKKTEKGTRGWQWNGKAGRDRTQLGEGGEGGGAGKFKKLGEVYTPLRDVN